MSSAIRPLLTDSLRGRLALWHLSILTLAMGTFAVLCYAVVWLSLYRHHDDELNHQAENVILALAGRPLEQGDIREALQSTPMGSRFVMIRNETGALVYRDPALLSSEPNIGQDEALVHAADTAPTTATFFTVDLEQTSGVRFICVPLRQPGFYLQIGDPLGDVQAMLRTIALSCLPLLPAVLLLAGIGGRLIGKRALSPVSSVTATLREIQATDLSRRVDVHPSDRELSALVATLNGLLDRLERSFESLRQFAGDVSHQLLTPLTVIKGTLDRALREPMPAGSLSTVVGDLAGEIDDIRAIVLDLRSFAFADAPLHHPVRVAWSDLASEASDLIAALGELRGVRVSVDVLRDVAVRGDGIRLKQVLLNLGDNAVKYTQPGGQVTIRLTASDDRAIVTISDTGAGIAEDDLPYLFDRHFRARAADRSADGTGLGLAIAKRIIDVHSGTIDVTSRLGTGTTFTVTLPRAR